MNSVSVTDWSQVADAYLTEHSVQGPLTPLLRRLKDHPPLRITEALDRDTAAGVKSESARFFLFAVSRSLTDHTLTEDELLVLRHLIRLLRIEEGDLLIHYRREVCDLLCLELERLLEDHAIDPIEAVHKVQLQELFGLSYDQFVALTSPEIEKVVVQLMRKLDPSPFEGPSPVSIQWFQQQLAALDTVYDRNSRSTPLNSRAGYLYLLVNPSMPGLVKIGQTSRKPDQRVAELTSASGVQTPFILVYELFVQDSAAAEKYAHARLEALGARVATNREFFNIPPSKAVELIQQARNALYAT